MFRRLRRKIKKVFKNRVETEPEPENGQQDEPPKRKFWHSVCSYVFDDYVKDIEDRADRALERHVKIRLRTAIVLLLLMIAGACISLLYLYVRKRLGL